MSWVSSVGSLSSSLSQYSVRVYLGGVVCILFILLIASGLHHRFKFTKRAFFGVISGIVLSVTATLLLINLQLINRSAEGGLTKKTGKMSIFVCGQELSIRPDSSLFTGSTGDSRHKVYPNGTLEYLGYSTEPSTDGSLGSFFRATGGSISSNVLAIPYNDQTASTAVNQATLTKFVKTNPIGEKYLELRSGEPCETTPSKVSVFVYEFNPNSKLFSKQRILEFPEQYILSTRPTDEQDCLVIVYGDPMTDTELTCQGYPDISKVSTMKLEATP